MTHLNGLAMTPAKNVASTTLRSLRLMATVGLSALLLAACGGGAQTTDNPLVGTTPNTGYNGPVASNDEVRKFQDSLWTNVESSSRCGGCHNEQIGQTPMFARGDDINLAYDAAITVVTLSSPQDSRLVAKVGNGHNCWVADDQVCSSNMATWITNWSGGSGIGAGREISLDAPVAMDPGASRSYANADILDFQATVYPLLTQYCAGCHTSSSPTSQSPYFAEPDLASAFDAAKSKMDLDDPANSRMVIRLRDEFHNCWNGDCPTAASTMEAAIQAFADLVPLSQIDPLLVNSKALRIVDGTVASGGNRFESAQIALYEFKTGTGQVAFDTSGVEPALDLNFSGDVTWYGGWGITVTDGKAQGSTTASKKLHDRIRSSGAYSIEAWVIPNNVTQEMARIVSYSAGENSRNFSLQQTLYDYNYLNRSTATSLNGDPAVSTPSANEVLQATLQHVVATYSELDGRAIYVNGELVSEADSTPGGSMVDWQDTFAFVLGNEVSGNNLWQGTLRLVAIHDRALTQEQVVQNFDVGVGEKFYLLFGIEDIINVPSAYILFEVSQFDSYSYLFNQPHFLTLDATQNPEGIPIKGMRIGINGAEAAVGQSFGKIDDTLSASLFDELGQPLSSIGAVVPLEKGPDDDEFFLTFDVLGSQSFVRTDDPPLVIVEGDLPPAQRFGVRTFDEINATMAAVTTVDPETLAVDMTFQSLRQSLPAVESPEAFLSSHQVAIAQMAIEYCNALVNDSSKAAVYFPGFDFGASPPAAFAGNNRFLIIDPLIDRVMGIAIQTQPDFTDLRGELGSLAPSAGYPGNLVDRLLVSADNPNTGAIAKAVCAAVVGSAVATVQ
jgi:Concanavalin A-like lectin/glucanases superfamily